MPARIRKNAAILQRQRLAAQRLNSTRAAQFTRRPLTKTAAVLSPTLITIDGRLATARNAGSPGDLVTVINSGRAASAVWQPADPSIAGAPSSGSASRRISTGTGGTGGTDASHTHPDYLTVTQADARYWTRIEQSAHVANANAHHPQQHQLDDTSSHALDNAEAATFVGTGAGGAGLTRYTARDDAFLYPGELLKSDANGALRFDSITTVTELITPQIRSSELDHLDLDAGVDIRTANTLRSYGWASGLSGAGIDFTTGAADFRLLTVDELIADSFTAAVTKALAGAFIITKSRSTLARPFVIPAVGQTAALHVYDIPGHENMPAFETGDDAMIGVFQLGTGGATPEPTPVEFLHGQGDSGAGTPGGQETYLNTDFESDAAGTLPANWQVTGGGNSLTPASPGTDFVDVSTDPADGANNTLRSHHPSAINFHAHWQGPGADTMNAYRITGRIKLTHNDGAAGITLFSDYPNSDSYYRIRRYNGAPTMHISNHGATTGPNSGTIDSGVSLPIGAWARFKIEIEDTGTETQIRARFWNDGDAEPGAWQINAIDSTANRYTAGTFGIWGYYSTWATHYDDILVENLDYTGGSTTSLPIARPIGTASGDYLMGAVLTDEAQTPTLAGFTLHSSRLHAGRRLGIYTKTATASEPATYTVSVADSSEISAAIVLMRNQDTGPISGLKYVTGTGSAAGITPTEQPIRDNSLQLLFVVAVNSDAQINNPAGMTAGVNTGDATSGRISAFFETDIDTGAPPPARSLTFSESTDYILATLVVGSAPAGAGDSSAIISRVWGQLTAYAPGSEPETDEGAQAWQFTTTRTLIAGNTIAADAPVLDFGVDGDGVIEMTTLDPTGPYIQAYKRGAEPWESSQNELIFRAGGIGGTPAAGTFGTYITQPGEPEETAASIENSEAGAWIRNTKILQSFGTKTVIDFGEDRAYMGKDLAAGLRSFQLFYDSGDLIIGRTAGGSQYMQWDESGGTLFVRGRIEIQAGTTGLDNIADGTTYGKTNKTILAGGFIQVGSGTKDSTLDGWNIGANSEIVGQLDGTDQVTLNTAGQITAGAGAAILDAGGFTVKVVSGLSTNRRYTLQHTTSGREVGYIGAGVDTVTAGDPTTMILAARSAGDSAGVLSATGVIGLLSYPAGATTNAFDTGQYPDAGQLWVRDRNVSILGRGLWIGEAAATLYTVDAGRIRLGTTATDWSEAYHSTTGPALIFRTNSHNPGHIGARALMLAQSVGAPTRPSGYGAIYFDGTGAGTLRVVFPDGTSRIIVTT